MSKLAATTSDLNTRMSSNTKLTSKRIAGFLAALSAGASVTNAATAIGMARGSLYQARNRDTAFRDAWDDAIESGTDELEDECRRRAIAGSDVLLIFLLKARRPEKYRERISAHLTGGLTLEALVLAATSPEVAAPPAHGGRIPGSASVLPMTLTG